MELHTPSQLKQLQQDLPHLLEIMDWVENFVAKSHSDLGRNGPVCPFVPHAIRSNSMRLAILRAQNLEMSEIAKIVLSYRDLFHELEPLRGSSAIKKTLLIIVPDIDVADAPKIIDGTQQVLKPFFVESGLMIGEFHKHTQGTGAHNPNFLPFQSPLPMFVIRNMVESDLLFLQDKDLRRRIQYLQAYLRYLNGPYHHLFEQRIKDENKLKKAQELIELAQRELELEPALV